uniref:MalT-like TPR region domain-containing protein n=1 Tax=Corethron hystrix TaxID=216773 RepID=A0A7S1FNK1_9STRA
MIVRMDKGEDIFADEEDKKSCEADLDDDDDDDVDFASAVGGAGAAPKEKKINPAKQAELDEYISILTKTQLRVKEGEIPAHSEEVGNALYNVGATYMEMGLAADAIPHFLDAEKVYQSAFEADLTEEERAADPPPRSPLAIDCLRTRGLASETAGNLDEALEIYEESVSMQRNHAGPHHPLLAMSHNNVGALHVRRKNFKKAREEFGKSAAVHRGENGTATPLALIETLVQLGNVCVMDEELEDAEKYYDEAVEIQTLHVQEAGETVDKSTKIANLLEHIAQMQGRYGAKDLAISTWKKEVEIREAIVGPKGLAFATSHSNLAVAYAANKLWDKAISAYEESIEIIKKAGGAKKHRGLLIDAYRSTANIYVSKLDGPGTIASLRKVLEINKEVLGDEHKDVAVSLVHLADMKSNMKMSEEALVDYEHAIEMYERLDGEDSISVADVNIKLGNVYINLSRGWKAMESYQEALSIRKKKLGKKHPETGEAIAGVGLAQAALGDFEQAMLAADNALKIYKKNKMSDNHPMVERVKQQRETAENSYKYGAVLRL